MPIKVAIAGINGKMGRASARMLLENRKDSEFQLVGAFGKANAHYAGQDVGDLVALPKAGILVSNRIEDILINDVLAGDAPDVLLEFSQAEAAVTNAKRALESGVRPVIGTSGIEPKEIEALSTLAKQKSIGAMIVPNFSVGAVLMMEFARQAGELYKNVEIIEMHHTKKTDAPSGTAMYTTRKLDSLGTKFNEKEVEEKELLPGARGCQSPSGVRVHSLRLPGLISHQEVIFGSAGELLTIRHDSFNTDCFLKGILLALKAVMKLDNLVVGLESFLVSAK